jgi:hypothetical protein
MEAAQRPRLGQGEAVCEAASPPAPSIPRLPPRNATYCICVAHTDPAFAGLPSGKGVSPRQQLQSVLNFRLVGVEALRVAVARRELPHGSRQGVKLRRHVERFHGSAPNLRQR